MTEESDVVANYVKSVFLNLFNETTGISLIPEKGWLIRCDVRP